MQHDALLYDERNNNAVQCQLCAHRCLIREGGMGICRVRENRGGKLFTLVYGNLISKNIDPIEKKPLYHFLPGSKAFSVATPGCNFRCGWCQNWQISQLPQETQMLQGRKTMPEEIVEQAVQSGCKSIAYTYTEPTIFFEYSYDIAKLATDAGLKNVYVTNGFMTSEMLRMIEPYLDAANVDIKAFRDETYRALMGGRLEPVLESCRLMKSMGIWLEITTLIVPGINDDLDELKELAAFICEDLGAETPWHLSRFYPQYQMTDVPPTDESILEKAVEIGKSTGLDYIYVGNLLGRYSTNCKKCGQELISRRGYSTKILGLNLKGQCRVCNIQADGVGLVGEP